MAGEWPVTRLGDIARVKHGFAFDGALVVERETPDVLVTPGNFEIGGGFKQGKFKYYSGKAPSEYVLKPGDVVITMTDLSKASDTLGYSALVPAFPGHRFLHNQRIGKLEISNPAVVDKRFLYWLFRTSTYRNEILASSTGTSIKHTAPSRIEAFCFRMPPLAKQSAIAHILGTLDDKIELNRRMNETLEAMARALFKSWFVDFDPVRAKAEGRDPGLPKPLADLFPDSFEDSELGEIPQGWKVAPFCDVCENIFSGGTPSTTSPSYWGGNIPWLSSGETRSKFIIGTEKTITSVGVKNSSTRLARSGASVIAGAGQGHTRGQTSMLMFDSYINQSVVALLAHPHYTSDTHLFFDLERRYEQFRQVSDGHSSRGSLTTKLLGGLQTVVAPRLIVEAFDRITVPIIRRIAESLAESRALAPLRDTLLPKLISGELRPKVAERIAETMT